ncbi:kinase-like domain-containing protein [Chaetomium sp. MPI-CAGE-AT-0009]|nr:kinase-like domain-containing protein [Chaetomium sp. MPI-CAGE-AT-0009]
MASSALIRPGPLQSQIALPSGLPQSQTGYSTRLAVNNLVIDDSKRVEKLEDRGEATYRRLNRFGHSRKDIKTDKATDSIITDVGDQLDKAQVNFDPQHEDWFIPRASFEEIFTPEVIAQVVNQLACYRNMSPEERIQVASDIYYGKDSGSGSHPPCRKLLATLIGMQGFGRLDTVEEVKALMDEGMNDDCLPLISGPDGLLTCRLHEQAHPFINHEGRRRGEWRRSFTRWSRNLMVPYILWGEGPESLHRHYVMHGGGPLPMAPVSESSGPQVHHNGGFGDVLKVKIEAGDRNFQGSRSQDSFFALKKLKENGEAVRTEFDLEVRSLIFTENRANRVPGPDDTETKNHVIQLLATFEVYHSSSKRPTYYLLFPWADGNLEEFWKQQDGKFSPRNPAQTTWMIEQFYHLAKAIQCLHNDRQSILSKRTDSNRYGRHGDIKPSNFLFFCASSGPGFKLVLADFGLGRLHSKATKSHQPPDVPKTVTYAAPEYDLEGGLLSPRSDIFSLGCVWLEHMVWLFQGYDAVQTFTNDRMTKDSYGFVSDIFWKVSESDRTSAEVKDKVMEQLETLKNHDDCVEVIGEILEVIETKMLQPKQQDRCTSQDLVHELERIRHIWERRDSFYEKRTWKESSLSRKTTLNTAQNDAIPIADPQNMLEAASANPGASGCDPPTQAELVIGHLERSKPLAPRPAINSDAGQFLALESNESNSRPEGPGDEPEGPGDEIVGPGDELVGRGDEPEELGEETEGQVYPVTQQPGREESMQPDVARADDASPVEPGSNRARFVSFLCGCCRRRGNLSIFGNDSQA